MGQRRRRLSQGRMNCLETCVSHVCAALSEAELKRERVLHEACIARRAPSSRPEESASTGVLRACIVFLGYMLTSRV